MEELWELISSEQATRVFDAYWPWILAGLAVIAKVVRRGTLHWSLWPKATRVIGLLFEVLDFIHIPKLKPKEEDFEKAQLVASNSTTKKEEKLSARPKTRPAAARAGRDQLVRYPIENPEVRVESDFRAEPGFGFVLQKGLCRRAGIIS